MTVSTNAPCRRCEWYNATDQNRRSWKSSECEKSECGKRPFVSVIECPFSPPIRKLETLSFSAYRELLEKHLDELVHVGEHKVSLTIWWVRGAQISQRSSIIMSLSSPRYSYIDIYFRDTLLAHVE